MWVMISNVGYDTYHAFPFLHPGFCRTPLKSTEYENGDRFADAESDGEHNSLGGFPNSQPYIQEINTAPDPEKVAQVYV
jgi:hypothetical protein